MFAKRLLSMMTAAIAALFPGAAFAASSVVVTSKPIHALVSSVMAGVGTPELLVDGTASPHAYAMKPSDAQKVHSAQVLFRVSEELEPFTAKLVSVVPASVRVESLAEAPGVNRLPMREGGAFEPQDEHDHGDHDHDGHHDNEHRHHGSGYDPHVWLDPENAKAMVSHIAEVLANLTPERAAAFRSNAEAELGRIDALSDEIAMELTPLSDKAFVVYHDAFQYFEKRFGLAAAGSVTVSPDLPPSGRRLRELRGRIASVGAVCVFAEPYLAPRVTEVLVEGTQVRTGTLDPEGTTLPSGPDLYHKLMRNLAEGFRACLSGS